MLAATLYVTCCGTKPMVTLTWECPSDVYHGSTYAVACTFQTEPSLPLLSDQFLPTVMNHRGLSSSLGDSIGVSDLPQYRGTCAPQAVACRNS